MQEFISFINKEQLLEKGIVSAKSPSNIALIKYWGKKEMQIPTNASISYSLSNCYTETNLSFELKQEKGFSVKVFFEGKKNEGFEPKILKFFKNIQSYLPFLEDYHFKVETTNTFPHSSGIASSASGLSALAICLLKMEQMFAVNYSENNFLKKASFLARIGSGSASRSIYNGLVSWGKHSEIIDSSDLYATPYRTNVHPIFQKFNDVILLIHDGEKSMSSTVGHGLMNNHPYAEERFKQANLNMTKLLKALEQGDLEEFGRIVEHEALSLHAMMLTSNPAFILMQPKTLNVIQKVWEFRKQTNAPLYFTLDAGANVHLLFPETNKKLIQNFIKDELAKYCINGKYILDESMF